MTRERRSNATTKPTFATANPREICDPPRFLQLQRFTSANVDLDKHSYIRRLAKKIGEFMRMHRIKIAQEVDSVDEIAIKSGFQSCLGTATGTSGMDWRIHASGRETAGTTNSSSVPMPSMFDSQTMGHIGSQHPSEFGSASKTIGMQRAQVEKATKIFGLVLEGRGPVYCAEDTREGFFFVLVVANLEFRIQPRTLSECRGLRE